MRSFHKRVQTVFCDVIKQSFFFFFVGDVKEQFIKPKTDKMAATIAPKCSSSLPVRFIPGEYRTVPGELLVVKDRSNHFMDLLRK